MQAAELSVLNWIQENLRSDILDSVMITVSRICNHGEIWILLAVMLLLTKKYRQSGICLANGIALDYLMCNLLMKPIIGRIRPFVVNTAAELLVAPPVDASFPSGHTAVSFAAVTALKTAGNPLWKPALVLAVCISFSRLYLYVHWPTDILGGIIVGSLAGWLGTKLVEKATKKLKP